MNPLTDQIASIFAADTPLTPTNTGEKPTGPQVIGVTPLSLTIDPVTRIEGHLAVRVVIDDVNGERQVVDAYSTGTAFRGIEKVLVGRHPWDAIPITQRICGVCPVSHGLAAALAVEQATGISAPTAARILRNLVLASNFLQSHVLHFYHLAALDFMAGPGMAPWQPGWSSDLRLDAAQTATLTDHYLQALDMRRIAHEMGAAYGGRLPHPPTFVPGGFTSKSNATRRSNFVTRLNQLIAFIQNVYVPDVQLLGTVYDDYFALGGGSGNLLSFGVFDQDAAGSTKLLARGRVENASTNVQAVNLASITESVTSSWYANSTNNLPPATGETTPQYPKFNAYSWLKAPRYSGQAYEAGPLARMWVNGDYRSGISVMDRHMARALEALKVAQAMQTWMTQLVDGATSYTNNTPPAAGTGIGLTEAPRGAIGHWLTIAASRISRYQVITPTCWNCSPRSDNGVRGPMEQALIGTPVLDEREPVEVLRVVHSYDPCMSCSVHVMRGDLKTEVVSLPVC